MSGDFVIRLTADGSDTLYSATMDEAYHSLNGAVQESMHVFINAGLHQISRKTLRIFEVGFGTGLNALLTWREAKRLSLNLTYESIEAFPVPADLVKGLNYQHLVPGLPDGAFERLHQSPWNEPVVLEPDGFTLTKIHGDFREYVPESPFDLVFFDAFAPDKQPELWQESLFSRLFSTMKDEGILVTYCAKGEVRRRMQRAGYSVERLPGPPGKREMLRARKIRQDGGSK